MRFPRASVTFRNTVASVVFLFVSNVGHILPSVWGCVAANSLLVGFDRFSVPYNQVFFLLCRFRFPVRPVMFTNQFVHFYD